MRSNFWNVLGGVSLSFPLETKIYRSQADVLSFMLSVFGERVAHVLVAYINKEEERGIGS